MPNLYTTEDMVQSNPTPHNAIPFKFDLAFQVLEEDEILQEDVPSEVAVAQLEVHQLQREDTELHNEPMCIVWLEVPFFTRAMH